MDYFDYVNGELHCEETALSQLAAEYGTPLYVYSYSTLVRHIRELKRCLVGLDTKICYAVKANSHRSILSAVAAEGYGADIVSGGELRRSLEAGVKPENIVFSGVGKSRSEIEMAMQAGILSINVESEWELDRILEVYQSNQAFHNKPVSIFLRINLNIDADTNEKIKTGLYDHKFGLAEPELGNCLTKIKNNPQVQLRGIACHIGSQIVALPPFEQLCQKSFGHAERLRHEGFPIEYIDVGGGIGITYHQESTVSLEDYANLLKRQFSQSQYKIILEPGRVLVGNTAVLLTRVEGVKNNKIKSFVICDAGMNDLPRVSLYSAYHEIVPVHQPGKNKPLGSGAIPQFENGDIVGPICESSDVLGKGRPIKGMQAGDLLAVRSCGAYCYGMTSNYNSRPKPAEVMVCGKEYQIITPRQNLESLWQEEREFSIAGS